MKAAVIAGRCIMYGDWYRARPWGCNGWHNAWTSAERHEAAHGTPKLLPRAEPRLPSPPPAARGDRWEENRARSRPQSAGTEKRKLLTGQKQSDCKGKVLKHSSLTDSSHLIFTSASHFFVLLSRQIAISIPAQLACGTSNQSFPALHEVPHASPILHASVAHSWGRSCLEQAVLPFGKYCAHHIMMLLELDV